MFCDEKSENHEGLKGQVSHITLFFTSYELFNNLLSCKKKVIKVVKSYVTLSSMPKR